MAATLTNETRTGETDSIKQDIQKLRDDMGVLLGHIGSFSTGKLGNARERLGTAAEDLQGRTYDRWHGATSGASERGRHAVDVSRDTVQQRPLTYVAAAFVAGMILASIFGWKRQS